MARTRVFLAALLIVLVGGFVWLRFAPAADSTAKASVSAQGAGKHDGHGGAGAGRSIAVVTAIAATTDVAETRDAIGWIEPVATVAVKPRIDGVIVDQLVTDGETVKEGDVLFRLDDSALRATLAKDQAGLAKDQANLDLARGELSRQKDLLDRHVATEQAYEEQQATVKVQEATVAMDEAQIQADQVQLGYTTIKAPISGRTGAVNVTRGNTVRAADTSSLVTITEMAPVRASFTVPERDLDRYRAAQASGEPVAVDVSTADSDKAAATGALAFIDSSVDTSAGTITLKATFDNADGALWPGQYVKVKIRLGTSRNATVVPVVAIQQNNDGPFVFLVKPDKTVAITPVTLGVVNEELAMVTGGVAPGDHVVIDGQVKLANGTPVNETVSPSAQAGKAG